MMFALTLQTVDQNAVQMNIISLQRILLPNRSVGRTFEVIRL